MGLLEGKRIVITGVLTDASLAFGVATARAASRAPRSCSPAPDAACRSPSARPASCRRRRRVLELDVTVPEHLDAVRDDARRGGGASTACSTRSGSRPAVVPGRRLPRRDMGRTCRWRCRSRRTRSRRSPTLPAADDRRRRHRRARLRRQRRLAGVRLDGRRQGRARVDVALPRSRARAEGHPGQPRRRRTDPHDGGKVDPRLLAVRGRVGRAAHRSVGTSTTRPRWRRRASRCCPTGSPRRQGRSSTSTAAITRSARDSHDTPPLTCIARLVGHVSSSVRPRRTPRPGFARLRRVRR